MYYRFDNVNHAGGVQALGSMVFVANEDDSNDAYIQILDLRNPFDLNINKDDRYINQLVIDGRNGEPTNSSGELINDAEEIILSKASSVAATRLADGKYLMFVGGRGSGKYGWFYISDSPKIDKNTKWNFIDFWDTSDLPEGTKWGAWETINFISDAKTGDIYMVAMGTEYNKSHLYRLTATRIKTDGNPDLNFEYINGRRLNASGIISLLGVSTRWGAGIHVTPNRNIVSYVTNRQPKLKINEFRYKSFNTQNI